MLRKWLWLGMVALAVAGFAQTFTVIGSSGWGAAVNADGKPAHFRYEVRKVTSNDTGRQILEGFFRFAVLNRQERAEVTIDLVRLAAYWQRLTPDQKVAEFQGPAVLSVLTPRGGRRVRGQLTVLVRDNRPPGAQEGAPDEIAVRFVAGDASKPFVFRGKVMRGDIVVYERHQPR